MLQKTPQKLISLIFTNVTISYKKNSRAPPKHGGKATRHCTDVCQKNLAKNIFLVKTYENFKIKKSLKNIKKTCFFRG